MIYIAVVDLPQSVFTISSKEEDVRGWGNRIFKLEKTIDVFSFIFECDKKDVWFPTKINFIEGKYNV